MSFFSGNQFKGMGSKSCDIFWKCFTNLEVPDIHQGLHRGVICRRCNVLLHQSQIVKYLDR